jgi:hypothetical protein
MNIIERNPKLGYYRLGNETFYSKPLALIRSTQINQHPTWHFNEEIFSKFNWQQEPNESILEIYRRRARQLREQYDYIKLEFSGGGDSTTTLYSFVNNNIHLDEVIFRHPKQGEKNVSADPYNTKAENNLSEWNYAAKPILDWLAIHHPKTKITFHDYSENMLSTNIDESWVFKTRDYFQPGFIFKHDIKGLDNHRRILDSGKKFCTLYGIDKPKICIRDGKWYVYFLDILANMANPNAGEYLDHHTNEYFFWTPDLPEILIKQAHIIKNWFELPSNRYLRFLMRWPNYSWSQRNTYEQIIRPLIYPEYDPTTFQVLKPTNSFYNEMDHWFYTNFRETKFYQTWQAGLQHLIDNIDPKYFNYEIGKPVGLIGFLSEFYHFGDMHPGFLPESH